MGYLRVSHPAMALAQEPLRRRIPQSPSPGNGFGAGDSAEKKSHLKLTAALLKALLIFKLAFSKDIQIAFKLII